MPRTLLVCGALCTAALCQEPLPEANRTAISSRAGEIEAQRERKARQLQPDQPSRIEHILQTVKNKEVLERITNGVGGVRAHLGGLVTGSGFAAGPEYYRSLARDSVVFRASVRGSLRKFYVLDLGLEMPKLADGHIFVDFYGVHRDYPHIDYYGPGPDSSKAGRTGFTLEDTSFDLRTGVRPVEHLRLGVAGRYWLVNVGPGRDDRFASADRVYSPALAPGILQQANYLIGGGFIECDWRDNPGGPRRGGNYTAQYTAWSDDKLRTGSFDRLDLEAQQYISFFNQRRVIALRGRGSFTDPRSGQFVPFYAQPHLGGSDDLRGFRPFRFYDRNSLVFNGEYRWEVFSGLDMALFVDAGKVFHCWQDAGFGDLERSYGFGFRFNVRNDVFLRIDTGFSREGFQVWFKFNNVF